MTGIWSRRLVGVRGRQRRGIGKTLHSFISRIIRVLEPIGLCRGHYTQLIGTVLSEGVQPCGWVCVTRVLPLRLYGVGMEIALTVMNGYLSNGLSFIRGNR